MSLGDLHGIRHIGVRDTEVYLYMTYMVTFVSEHLSARIPAQGVM